MSSAKTRGRPFHVGDWVAFQYGSKKVAARIVEDRGPIGVGGRRLYRVQPEVEPDGSGQATAFEMPADEMEPTAVPVRQSFRVTYHRQGNTNRWRATTEIGKTLKGITVKGAVSYSTAMWARETEDEQKLATVSVLLEVDPGFGGSGIGDPAEAVPSMIEQARREADGMFLSQHPRARIEHVDSRFERKRET